MRAAVLIAALTVFALVLPAQQWAAGTIAPDFRLRYATKDSIAQAPLSLSEAVRGGFIILAFYPADWSSGCTREVCAMRDAFGELAELGADVLGISGDYVYSHHAWAKHHGLPFRLLSDHLHEVARQYDSYNEQTGYNRRTVFLVGPDRTVRYADLEYSVRDDEDFNRLKKAIASEQGR